MWRRRDRGDIIQYMNEIKENSVKKMADFFANLVKEGVIPRSKETELRQHLICVAGEMVLYAENRETEALENHEVDK